MGSTFAGVAAASNGLVNSQYAMYVTTANISNANTDGYSVQNVVQRSGTSSIKYNTTTDGAFATVDAIQAQSYYLNSQYWEAQSAYSYWNSVNTMNSNIESSFHTLDETGFSALYDDFITSMNSLATAPNEASSRALMAEYAQSFCDSLNQTAKDLLDQQSMINDEICSTVDQINGLSLQIANLNTQIKTAALEGSNTNALQDQQDFLIDQLSELVKVDVNTLSVKVGDATYQTVQISIGGTALVSDNMVSELSLQENGTLLNGETKYDVIWSSTQNALDTESGTLGALFEMRDGDTVTEKGIPYYMTELDTWASSFAQAFNEGITDASGNDVQGHSDGYDLRGNTGIAFFTNDSLDSENFYAQQTDINTLYSGISALNISVNSDILENPDYIAVSDTSEDDYNAENLLSMLAITSSKEVFGTADPREAMTALITVLSSSVSASDTRFTSAESDYELYTTWRLSETSVSVDEEAAKLEAYQLSYNASAKVIEIWNEVIEMTLSLVGG